MDTFDLSLSIGAYKDLESYDKLPFECYSNKRLCLMAIEDWANLPTLARDSNFFYNLDFSLKKDIEVVHKSLSLFGLDEVLPYISYPTFKEVLPFAYAIDPLKIQSYEVFKSFVLTHANKDQIMFYHSLRIYDFVDNKFGKVWDQLFYTQIDLSKVY